MTQFAFTTRPLRPTDLPYVLSTWVKSARDASLTKGMSSLAALAFLRSIIVNQLEKPEVRAIAATPLDDDDTILGWSAYTDDTLHFVYVRSKFRGAGIARALVPPGVINYTFRTGCLHSVQPGWQYRPDLLFTKETL